MVNNYVEPLPRDIDQPVDWEKIKVTEDRFTKIVDALKRLQTQQLFLKNENALDNVQRGIWLLIF